MSKPDEVTTLMGVGPGRCGHGLPRRPTRRSSKNFYKVKFTASCESAADRPDGPGFSGSCTATSHNPLIQRGATTATKSEPFRPQRGAPGSIVKDLPLRREAACYRELPRIPLPRTRVNRDKKKGRDLCAPAPLSLSICVRPSTLLDCALLNLSYLVRHQTMRRAVYGRGRFLVRGVR